MTRRETWPKYYFLSVHEMRFVFSAGILIVFGVYNHLNLEPDLTTIIFIRGRERWLKYCKTILFHKTKIVFQCMCDPNNLSLIINLKKVDQELMFSEKWTKYYKCNLIEPISIYTSSHLYIHSSIHWLKSIIYLLIRFEKGQMRLLLSEHCAAPDSSSSSLLSLNL